MSDVNLRPELAGRLRHRLHAFSEGFRHNLAMIGPPGSGKTFQLNQILSHPPQHLLLVYCALYQESCRSFLQRLASAIIQAGLPHECFSSNQPVQPLETLLEQSESLLPNTVAALRSMEQALTKRLFAEAFTRALDAIPILMQERGRPVVLILDEFLSLEDLGLSHAFHELGKRVMTWPSVLFILTSSAPHRARAILRERLQLLFGHFELMTLDGLDQSTLQDWVQQQTAPIQGSSSMNPFLIEWLGAYPWYLAVVVKRLNELAALQYQDMFSERLFLQTAWDVLGSPEGALHQWCLSRTDRLTGSNQFYRYRACQRDRLLLRCLRRKWRLVG